ncbi:MAG: YggS family pyridoxal phosphate-dependent enzyme [Verrucomicrobia bacterium]|nr:YggS family pyridoxal phosphate-dependent enzyme [Cytophagales bacterium]
MNLTESIDYYNEKLQNTDCKLIAVSKTKPVEILQQAYDAGQKIFGENRVQELVPKYEALPKDIEWHIIGHLQSNKVKYIAPFVHLIHSVDSLGLLQEIDKQAQKNNRIINCLLQIYIATEETKFGLDFLEAEALLNSESFPQLSHIKITGLMGIATNTDDQEQIRQEFKYLKSFFDTLKTSIDLPNVEMTELSMGMSGDWEIALAEGSTLIRVGSAIFGSR